jgi:hypothetical protein
MILEGIVTTENADGSVNVSPMGPIVDAAMTTLLLRPYNTSTTYQNLRRSGRGVFHVTDNVEMLARAAVDQLQPPPELRHCEEAGGWILADACRWYGLRVAALDDSRERTEIRCDVVASGRLRDFFGLNRAKHAVVEAAILATRTKFLPPEQIHDDLQRLAVLVEKTGGNAERRAFAFLQEYIATRIAGGQRPAANSPDSR